MSTRALAGFAADVAVESLPAEVVAKAGALVLDFLGAATGGAEVPEVAALTGLVLARGGVPQARVVGTGAAAPLPDVAFCAGAAADVLEHQDGYRFGGFHPSHAIPAVLAVAEHVGADLSELLAAVVVAYEVANRVARAAHPAATRAGWFPTAASFGAAAACARLLGLDENGVADAIGAAAFFAPGVLIESIFAAPGTKPAFAGQIARAGVEAALAAQAGLSGWREVIEHPRGLVAVLGGDGAARVADGLGEEWTVLDVHQKWFAGCRHTHGAAQATAELAETHALDPGQVTAVDVETYDIALLLVDRPAGPDPSTITCTLSLPFAVGAALADRHVGGAQYAAGRRDDPAVLRIADLVRLRRAEDLEARYPEYTATRVTLTTADGTRHTRTVDIPVGDSRVPMDRDRLLAKFTAYTEPVFGRAATSEVAGALLDGEPMTVRDLVALMTSPNEKEEE